MTTTVPGASPWTTLVDSWAVCSIDRSAAAEARILIVDAGISGVVSPCCHSAVPVAGSITTPVNGLSTAAAAGPASAAPTPDALGVGASPATPFTESDTFAGGAGGAVVSATSPPNKSRVVDA
jgi:hypothetical protein